MGTRPTTRTSLGHLWPTSRDTQYAETSAASTTSPVRGTTKATGCSPQVACIRHTDDADHADLRVSVDHLLDLAREDVEALDEHHVLLAVGDKHEAVLVEVGNIARVASRYDAIACQRGALAQHRPSAQASGRPSIA
jgi:hypothetical protein